jgi:NAD(P)H dehydrogenase (quinone)
MIPIKVFILHYSSYGHVERMAQAVDAGVKESGAEAVINEFRN